MTLGHQYSCFVSHSHPFRRLSLQNHEVIETACFSDCVNCSQFWITHRWWQSDSTVRCIACLFIWFTADDCLSLCLWWDLEGHPSLICWSSWARVSFEPTGAWTSSNVGCVSLVLCASPVSPEIAHHNPLLWYLDATSAMPWRALMVTRLRCIFV